tara:strand:- start:397 stop:1020 length:624 start_codon:yes stop_codon:yes gene_type:complete
MGDALSTPKGEWDNEIEEEAKNDKDEKFSKAKLKADAKVHISLQVPANDFYAVKSVKPGYNADLAARVPLAASYDRGSEILLKEFISETLQEVTSMSVRVIVKGSLGDTYKSSKANVSNVNQMSPGDPSIKQKGYGQSVGTQDMYPYIKSGKPTTDGGETMRRVNTHVEDDFNWNDPNYTTSDHLLDTMDQDYLDWENVKSHNRRFK